MKQIYNRALALFLVVVLCSSMAPFSAFATEAEPDADSAVSSEAPLEDVDSSMPEEPPAEETPSPDDASSMADNMQTVEMPTLRARDPISKVQSDLGNGSSYLTNYGVSRKAIVDELSAHEHDSYYLGTPYAGGDVQSPNGDTSYNGSAGMNCGGFVGYVLRKAGLNSTQAVNLIKSTGDALYFGSGKPYAAYELRMINCTTGWGT